MARAGCGASAPRLDKASRLLTYNLHSSPTYHRQPQTRRPRCHQQTHRRWRGRRRGGCPQPGPHCASVTSSDRFPAPVGSVATGIASADSMKRMAIPPIATVATAFLARPRNSRRLEAVIFVVLPVTGLRKVPVAPGTTCPKELRPRYLQANSRFGRLTLWVSMADCHGSRCCMAPTSVETLSASAG